MKAHKQKNPPPPTSPVPPKAPLSRRLADAWPALLAFAAAALAFSPILSNDLVNWDDHKNLLENFYYRGLGAANLKWMLGASFGFMGNYEPMHWLTMGLVYTLYGMAPKGYHLMALLEHSAAAAAFYFVALGLLKAAEPEAQAGPLKLCALAAALLFGVHPLRVEEVAWASGQHYAEAGLFYLLAVLAYLRAVQAPRGGLRAHLAALGLFALSLLSLPIGMTLPFTLLILDLYPLKRWSPEEGRGPQARALLREKAPYFALALAGGVVGLLAKKADRMLIPLARHGLGARAAISFYGLAYYVGRTLLPASLYPFHELRGEVPVFSAPFLAAYASVLALTALFLALRKRWPAGLAAWACYVVALAPVSGLTQSGKQVVADRYTYLSCLAWPLLAAGALLWLSRGERRRRLFAPGLALAAAAALALSKETRSYAGIWRTSESLWAYTLSLDPGIALGHNNLGNAFARQGRIDEAMAHYEESLKIDPAEVDAHNNMGNALSLKGRYDEAVAHYRRALAIFPGYIKAYNGLGNALRNQGRVDEAALEFRKALALDPDNADAHNNLGIALISGGKPDEALREFEAALRINPGFEQARANLRIAREREARPDRGSLLEQGLAAARAGDIEGGARLFRRAVAADPKDAAARNNLGVALGRLNKPDEAIAQYREALRLMPGYAEAHVNLGIALASKGLLSETEAEFRAALRLRPNAPDILLNLGLVLDKQGRPADAKPYYRKVLELDPDNASAKARLAGPP